jgi:general secretion pathway protein L
MLSELKELLAVWIAAVAAAVEAVMSRIVPQRRVLLVEGDDDGFTVRASVPGKTMPPAAKFRLSQGRIEPALSGEWRSALRGSRLDVLLRPDQVLFRPIDFPKAAANFLDGMVRAQIDRLTPWAANEAVFGLTAPAPMANERIALTLAATSRQRIQPLLRLAADVGAVSVTGLVEAPDAAHSTEPIRVFDQPLTGVTGAAIDVPKLLSRTLLGSCVAAAASLALAAYVGSVLDAEQQDLQRAIAQRRAALFRVNQGGGSAETLLAKRKQTSPSSVMVLEAITRALPDSTYVTELRVEGDKVQVVGLTQDAPSLIRLMEQSPQFTRATFFAPTTRGQNEAGERFHIEAHITPYFGLPS